MSQNFENGGLLTNSSVPKLLILVFDTRRIPPWRTGACNTLKEPAGGLWGILNEGVVIVEKADTAARQDDWSSRRGMQMLRIWSAVVVNSNLAGIAYCWPSSRE